MKSAVDAVRQNQMALKQAAKQFNVPKATLQCHVKRISQDGKQHLGRSQELPEEIEAIWFHIYYRWNRASTELPAHLC